jgi:prephenate dehydrogenase
MRQEASKMEIDRIQNRAESLGCPSKDIFKGANYIFTPMVKNKQENLLLLENIVKKICCKNIVKIDSKRHNEIISYTSHLPHIIAVALMNSERS